MEIWEIWYLAGLRWVGDPMRDGLRVSIRFEFPDKSDWVLGVSVWGLVDLV